MTLSEMRSLLATDGIRLTRSLGQSFLHDSHQLHRIVALAGIQPGQRVLEIGPGLGPLTECLLAAGARVLAIEIDRRLVEILKRRFDTPALELVNMDALRWLESEKPDARDWAVVANLPYSVGSRVLVELTHLEHPPESITVTLQAEVVDRLRATAGTSAFGILTLLMARDYTPVSSFRISASCFFPEPDVESACVRLERRAVPLVSAEHADLYTRLVKVAFSQRRKRLPKVLRAHFPGEAIDSAWSRLGLSADIRAEALSPETFAALTSCLASAAPGSATTESATP